jgi:hypothetical protein
LVKVMCPQCHVKGFLEVRGSSARVKHYVGMKNGKGIYKTHRIDVSQISSELIPKNKTLIPTDS